MATIKIFGNNKFYCLNEASFDLGPRLFDVILIYRTYPNQEICYPLIQCVGYSIDSYQYNNEYFSFKQNMRSKSKHRKNIIEKIAISKIHLPTAIIAITMIAIKPCST